MEKNLLDYELLDSGNGERLERFGDKILIRPASLAVWKKRLKCWDCADAKFSHESGWTLFKSQFSSWQVKLKENLSLNLHLQRNGQIGVFPEHATYLKELSEAIKDPTLNCQHEKPKVLNLFAYTGMASVFCRSERADVTHVDKAKQVLNWAKENLECNGIKEGIRLIPEDALVFLEREKKRGRKYQIIIADPPNFSRISKNENWDLDKVIINLLSAIVEVLIPGGYLFISSHQSFAFAETINNLLYDTGRLKKQILKVCPLNIRETSSCRTLPAGIMLYGKLN